MKTVFLDTNVLIDLLTNREPYSVEAAQLFEYARRGMLTIYVSSLSIKNINYIIGRLESKKKARKLIEKLLLLIEILPVGQTTVEKSLLSEFKDFEDALQNFCAEEGGLNTIVTRNTKDYLKSELSIQTPKEYLSSILT